MKNLIMTMLSLTVMAVSMQAQTLSGKLVDEKNEPLAYANVVLQQVDSTFVSGQTSDEKGDFLHHRPTLNLNSYQPKISLPISLRQYMSVKCNAWAFLKEVAKASN